MFQIHQYNFANSITAYTYSKWVIAAFGGDVPTCFEDIPFDLEADRFAPLKECPLWKHIALSQYNDRMRFESIAQHSPAYGCTQTAAGWEYHPDRIVDNSSPHPEDRYRCRISGMFLDGYTYDYNTAAYFLYPHSDQTIEMFFNEPVTVDKFIARQGHSDAGYQIRNFKVEYKESDGSWTECYNDSIYPHGTGTYFVFPGGPVTSREFRITPLSGYSTWPCYLGGITFVNSDEPRTLEDFTPTWGLMYPGEWQSSYAEGPYRDGKHWPMILVKLNGPGVVGTGIRINRSSYKVGEKLEIASIYLANDMWESKGPDTEKPSFIAPTTIQLAATDASGTLREAPQIQQFFDSIDVLDNYDCHIDPTNDCPELLPLGDTVVTFTAVDRAGNEETHACTITIADMTGPVISITGDVTYTLEAGQEYLEEGATAVDNVDGDVTGNIVIIGSELVDENTLGIYTVDYSCTDAAGNTTIETRTITVEDSEAPVITPPNGNSFDAVDANGRPKSETDITAWLASATATDNLDASVTVTNDCPDDLPLGPTLVTFSATDSNDNTGISSATITIVDNTVPVITLTGNSAISVEYNSVFTEPGFTAIDNVDGDITGSVVAVGSVDTSILGDHVINYDVSDSAGNPAATVQRTVTVVDTIAPIITLTGDATVNLNEGDAYAEQGATASDLVDGDVTGSIVIASNVNTAVKGTYQVTYNVADNAGNNAVEVVRTVQVFDVTAPVITLIGDATIELNVDDVYTEQGATATDNNDGDISGNIVLNSNVNTALAGTYQVTYNVADASLNDAIEVVRTINVT